MQTVPSTRALALPGALLPGALLPGALLPGALLPATLALPHPAVAQRSVPPWERRTAPSFSVEGGGVYASMRGDLERLNDGFGFEAQARLGVSALSLGAGYQRSTHSIENFQSLGGDTERAVMSGVFLEPRVSLLLGGTNFTPYLSGRVARVTLTQSQANIDVEGTDVAGGGGLLVWLAPAAQLNLSALYSATRFDESALWNGRARGNALTLRAGVTVGF